MSETIYAVLTGDLVGSSTLSNPELTRALNQICAVPDQFNAVFSESVHPVVEIIRGDSWQMLVVQPGYALRTALFVRAAMKSEFSIDSRVSIGIGRVDLFNPSSLALSKGAAFEASGKGLDGLGSKKRLDYLNRQAPETLRRAEARLASWLDFMVTPASAAQARSLYHSLLDMKQEKVAEITGVVQSTVSEGLAAIGWNEIKATLQYFENIG